MEYTAGACRFCQAPLSETFAHLGMTPLANSVVSPDRARSMEPFYPLRAFVCGSCHLDQLEAVATPQHIFSDGIYFSSCSETWLRHAACNADFSSCSETWLRHAACNAETMTRRLGLGADAMVVEAGRNDGHARERGKLVAAYGAPAKGNTLLNYCGAGPDLVAFTVDRTPHKQGMLLPGTRSPVRPLEAILEAKPHHVLILPWNLRDETTAQMGAIRAWGGRFVVPIPATRVLP